MEGKKIKGRKRHITVDIMGNLLYVFVHAGNIHDTIAGIVAAHSSCLRYPTIKGFCGDQGYRKTFEEEVSLMLNRQVDISEKIKPNEWELLPKRWIVERTLSWFNGSRRLSKDYEISTSHSEDMVRVSHISLLLKRLLL